MTFAQYLERVRINKNNNPSWRMGQAYFNTLYAFRDDLSELVRGDTSLDPFYKDENLPTFLTWVCVNW